VPSPVFAADRDVAGTVFRDIDADGVFENGLNVIPPFGTSANGAKPAVGEQMTCTGAAPAPLTGPYTNVGSVSGVGPGSIDKNGAPIPGDRVTADDPANGFVLSRPPQT
jgi:hypothetical protein